MVGYLTGSKRLDEAPGIDAPGEIQPFLIHRHGMHANLRSSGLPTPPHT